MKKILLILLLVIGFSGYSQTYHMDKGFVMGMPTTFPNGSYIKIQESVLELNVITHKGSNHGVYRITSDESKTLTDRVIRDMRLVSDNEPNLRIHGMIVSGQEIQTTISVTVYDMNTQISLPYVIYTKD